MSAALALIGTGIGLQAFATIRQGQMAAAQGAFQEQVALRNQRELERQAKAEVAASRFQETQISRREKMFKAQQRAIIGKSSVGLVGATLSVLADTAFQFSLERNLVLRRGLIRGRELIARGGIVAAQGRWAAEQGRWARTSSYISAAGSILGGAGMMGAMAPSGGGTPWAGGNVMPGLGRTPGQYGSLYA